MPQTLLALFALGLVLFMSLGQQRQSAHVQDGRIQSDIDRIAAQVADDRLDALTALPFDNATRTGRASSVLELTRLMPLRTEIEVRFDSLEARPLAHLPTESGGINDLDDTDGTRTEVSRSLPHGTLRFQVETVVGYVSESNGESPSLSPTKLKKASVRVTPLGVGHVAPAVLSRLYSCGSACSW